MSYQSPIELVMGQMNIVLEGQICKAVQNAGVNVDKEELLKALQYDRGQYQKGYRDRDAEIVRCKDCKWRGNEKKCIVAFVADKQDFPYFFYDNHGEWFCADGEHI